MKKISLFAISLSFLMFSCTVDTDDETDFDTIGTTFEIENINFISNNGIDAAVNIVIPDDIPVFSSDVPLVYVLDPIESFNVGRDVFEPLPRVFFLDNAGFTQYRYNFTFNDDGLNDIEIILESEDFNFLDTDFTLNQIFRIVIVPSQFALDNPNISFDAVMNTLNL